MVTKACPRLPILHHSRELVVEAVLAGRRAETLVSEQLSEADLELGGMVEDRHHGLTTPATVRDAKLYPRATEIRNRRQLTIVSVEECAEVADRLGLELIQPEWLGANLLVRGLPELSTMPAGSRLVIPGGLGLVCEMENFPCRFPGEVLQKLHPEIPGLVKGFIREAYGRRGICASVERPGTIRPGDLLQFVPPQPHKTLT